MTKNDHEIDVSDFSLKILLFKIQPTEGAIHIAQSSGAAFIPTIHSNKVILIMTTSLISLSEIMYKSTHRL